jgi:predicted nucleotidyltransferase
MPSGQIPATADARAIADKLVQSFPAIEGVLLCGSVARGDADEWSDIDLVVIGSDLALTPSRMREALADMSRRVSLIYYPADAFAEQYRQRALFIAHLQKEGVILYDRRGLLKTTLAKPFAPVVDVEEGIRAHRARLAPYSDPRRFNNNFLFCLSHLYSIGKGVVMLGLAKDGVLEFNREAAFQRFAGLNPDLVEETRKIAQLRPFYRLVTGRRPEPLPFSYQAADRQMLEAVRAIETLARRAEKQ